MAAEQNYEDAASLLKTLEKEDELAEELAAQDGLEETMNYQR